MEVIEASIQDAMMDAFVNAIPGSPPFTISGAIDPLSGEMAIDIAIDSAMNIGTELSLSSLLNSFGISLDALQGNGQLNLLAGLLADFGFGLDIGDIFAGNVGVDSLFFDLNTFDIFGQLNATASMGFDMGMLAGGIEDATFALDGRVGISIKDDQINGGAPRLSLANLRNGTFLTLFDVVLPSASMDATMPITASVGGVDLGQDGPEIVIHDSNIFADPLPDVQLENFDKLIGFNLVGPRQVLSLLEGATDFLRQYTTSPVFDVEIPFTDRTLGGVFDASLALTRNLNSTPAGPLSVIAGVPWSLVSSSGRLASNAAMIIAVNGGGQVPIALDLGVDGQQHQCQSAGYPTEWTANRHGLGGHT